MLVSHTINAVQDKSLANCKAKLKIKHSKYLHEPQNLLINLSDDVSVVIKLDTFNANAPNVDRPYIIPFAVSTVVKLNLAR